MKVIVSGRNIAITESIKEQVDKKLSKFDKLFKSETEAFATFSTQKNDHIVEITIPLKNGSIIRAESRSEDMYSAIDDAIDKISRQLRKHKTKLEKRFQTNNSIRFDQIPEFDPTSADADEPKIVKSKRFAVKPMMPEEAVLQMELLNHDFYMFLNGDTNEINVVYKRKDGNYGIIEPEVE
ncbi:MAG: ribosome-associated translation inhibitor RaiA [Bacillota bacterium]|nr:ribosome-associated translation inhibitor RaiA [Bacillota bacterium]